MDRLLGLPILQVLLIVGFDSDDVFCLFMSRTAHDGKSTLAHLQINLKFVKFEWLLLGELLSATVNQVPEVSQRSDLILGLHLCSSKFLCCTVAQSLLPRHGCQTCEGMVSTDLLAQA